MRDWWRRFRAFDNKGLLVERVEGSFAYTRRGYVVNRWIFRAYLVSVLLVLCVVGLTSHVGWREFYVSCPLDAPGPCKNPFYLDCPVAGCRQIEREEFLPRGFSLGRAPDAGFEKSVEYAVWYVCVGFILTLGVNHYVHNRGRPFRYILPYDGEVEK